MTRLARRLAPAGDVDDVVQNALLRAWQKWALYDADRGTPTVWLLAITADQARSARRSRLRSLQVIDDGAALPEIATADAVRDLDLDRAVGQLAERQQLAVQLHYFLGLAVAEVGAVMGCSAGTVKSTLFDARARLRRLLGDDDEH